MSTHDKNGVRQAHQEMYRVRTEKKKFFPRVRTNKPPHRQTLARCSPLWLLLHLLVICPLLARKTRTTWARKRGDGGEVEVKESAWANSGFFVDQGGRETGNMDEQRWICGPGGSRDLMDWNQRRKPTVDRETKLKKLGGSAEVPPVSKQKKQWKSGNSKETLVPPLVSKGQWKYGATSTSKLARSGGNRNETLAPLQRVSKQTPRVSKQQKQRT